MTILAIDTSGPAAGAAIMRGGRILCEETLCVGLTHSESSMPMVSRLFDKAGMAPGDIDLYAAVAGPGSFTGVRIGVCEAKGLAHAVGKKALAVDALETLAMNAYGFGGIICPILDARRSQVYCAAFRFVDGDLPVRIMDDRALPLAEFLAALPPDEKCLFLGDGLDAHGPAVAEILGARAMMAHAGIRDIRAACACRIAYLRQGEAVDPMNLNPFYLRAPQAERERLAKGSAV